MPFSRFWAGGAACVYGFLTPLDCVLITTVAYPAAHSFMKPERILVPIDTTKCRPEVFSRVNAFAGRPEVTVILLHVLNLNIMAPENRIYEELAQIALGHLERLAREYMQPGVSVLYHVRTGAPVKEILAEAQAEGADLMILSTSGGSGRKPNNSSFWKRLFATLFPGMGQRLAQVSPCPLLVMHAETSFNCEEHWGSRVNDIRAALEYLGATSEASGPSAAAAAA
jgi:nucleotide-binding universal stress UspA family protein